MSANPSPVPIESLLLHREWMRGLARRLVGEDGADDVEQQAWLAALRSPPLHAGSVRGWLATVVRNAARQRDRSASRRRYREAHVDVAAHAPATDSVVAKADAHQRVSRAVMDLEEPYRTTVLLRFFEDLPPRDVATRMGVPVETVRTRTRRALARLRGELDADYGDRAAWRLALLPLFHEAVPRGSGNALPAAAAVAAGVTVMGTTTKIAIGAAAAALLLAGITFGPDLLEGRAENAAADVVARDDDGTADRAAKRPRRRRVSEEQSAATRKTTDVTSERNRPQPTTIVSVRRADSGSIEGATLLVALENGSVTTHALDDSGRANFDTPTGEVGLLAVVPGVPPASRSMAAGAAAAEIVVARGHEIAGLVRVNGMPPPAGFRIGLRAEDAWYDGSVLSDATREALLTALHVRPYFIPNVTDEAGRFVFAGLPDARRIHISLVDLDVHDAAGARAWEVSLGDRGVLLELVRDPHITGRVVSADGIPSADAWVILQWKVNAPPGADRSESPFLHGSMHRRTDDDGRFDIAVPGTEFVTLDLEIQDAEGNGVRTYGAPLQIRRDIDIGDLALGGVRAAKLIVVDEEGDPVAGAAVFHGGSRIGERTDAEGRTNVRLSDDATSFRVGAPLYAVTTVRMPASTTEPLRVVLAKGTFLGLRFRTPAGFDASGLRVRLSTDEPLFGGANHTYDEVFAAAGGSGSGSAIYYDDRTEVWFSPTDGAVRIGGMHPHVPFTVEVFDRSGGLRARREFRLEPREHVIEFVEVVGTVRSLAGVVSDESGRPIARARVMLRDAAATIGGLGVFVWTDGEGRFSIDGVLSERARIEVEKRRFASTETDVDLPSEALRVSLAPGRDVVIRVTGGEFDYVWAARIGSERLYARGSENDDGTYTLEDLPNEGIEIVVEKGERRYRFPCPPGHQSVEVNLPDA